MGAMVKTDVLVPAAFMLMMSVPAACTDGMATASDYSATDQAGWIRNREIVLKPNPVDSTAFENGLYDVLLSVRINGSYPYSDLWLSLDESSLLIAPHRDTIRISTVQPSAGESVKTRHGITEAEYLLRRRILPGAEYQIGLTHAMRLDTLPGVVSVGLRMIPAYKRKQ